MVASGFACAGALHCSVVYCVESLLEVPPFASAGPPPVLRRVLTVFRIALRCDVARGFPKPPAPDSPRPDPCPLTNISGAGIPPVLRPVLRRGGHAVVAR